MQLRAYRLLAHEHIELQTKIEQLLRSHNRRKPDKSHLLHSLACLKIMEVVILFVVHEPPHHTLRLELSAYDLCGRLPHPYQSAIRHHMNKHASILIILYTITPHALVVKSVSVGNNPPSEPSHKNRHLQKHKH